ncbi:hypothetical protein [Gordonia sp. VNK21]|uniref:hypothetical protein n=1 Tax=Gordonia sp. VNK21 TaxID=3382483 RepID=UPI0038D3F3F0
MFQNDVESRVRIAGRGWSRVVVPVLTVLSAAAMTACSDSGSPSARPSRGGADIRAITQQLVTAYNDRDEAALEDMRCVGEYAPLLTTHATVDDHLEQVPDGSRLGALTYTEAESQPISVVVDNVSEQDVDSMRPGQMELFTGGAVESILISDATAPVEGTSDVAHIQVTAYGLTDSRWCVSFFEGGVKGGNNGWD